MKEDLSVPTKTTRPGAGAVLAASLLAAALLLPAWGAGEAAAEETQSTCVACHTDKDKLKMESAGIKRAKPSAMQSGKG